MVPSKGRIVQYTMSREDVRRVEHQRLDGQKLGNAPRPGEHYPMMIVRVWGEGEDSRVNGQVFLDGNDTLWVTSVKQGEGEYAFREFPRV